MEKHSKFFKIAGILDCIFGIIMIKVPVFGLIYLLLGIFLLYLSSEEIYKLTKMKAIIIFIAVSHLIFNWISAVLIFLANDELEECKKKINPTNAPPQKQIIDPEIRKIDILLKLGIGMVFISGILFATTSWEFINDYIKAIILLILGGLFLGLSQFSETKLKLKNTAYMYWILSMAFFLLTIVGIQYFGVFGSYLTYNGAGSNLAYFITLIVLGILSYITYLKYNKKYLLYLTYLSSLYSIYHILTYIKLPIMFNLLVISIILLVINYLSKKETDLFNFSKIISYILFVFIINNIDDSNSILLLLTSLTNIVNLNYLTLKSKKNDENILNLIISYILIFITIYNIESIMNYEHLLAFLTITLYTVIINGNLLSNNQNYKRFNYIIYSLASLTFYLTNIMDTIYQALIIATIYLAINTFSRFKLFAKDELKITNYLEPIAIYAIILSIGQFNIFKDSIDAIYTIIVAVLIYCIINCFSENDKTKNIYLISSAIGTLMSISYCHDNMNFFLAFLPIIPSFYIFSSCYNNQNKGIVILGYLLLLISIYVPLMTINLLNINIIIIGTIFIALLLMIIYFFKLEILKKVTYFFIALPLYSMVNQTEISIIIKDILENILLLYLLFLLLKFIVSKTESRNIVGIIGTILIISNIFFQNNIFIGIYIGLVGLIIMMIGYYKNELSPFFKFGIILIIVNILYQLQDLWSQLPFWLYLLITGLGIIIFVTYKEIKKMK